MRRTSLNIGSNASDSRRHGTTLTEVLMSLMIMGIGVVSLATLFPIATLRVLEATNLTNATVARFNAEGIADSFPDLIHQPDGNANYRNLDDADIGIRSREAGSKYIVDPLGWWERFELLSLGGTVSVTNSQLTQFEYNRPATITLPLLQKKVVIPPFARPPKTADVKVQTRFLGENPSNRSIFTSLDLARQIASLPDTTTDIAEGFPDADGTVTTVYHDPNTDNRLDGIYVPSTMDITVVLAEPTLYQAVIFDKSGRFSEVRTLTDAGNTAGLIEWAPPLPVRFDKNVGLVRIERHETYYSWLLTVRKRASGPANVDVVVFNKRDFSELSDQVYIGDLRRFTLGADLVPGSVGDDNANGFADIDDVTEIGYPNSDDQPNSRVTIDWNPANYPGGAANPVAIPPLRRGGFIYDTFNALWYQIRSIESSPTTTSAIVVLDKFVSRNNTEDLDLDGKVDLNDLDGDSMDESGSNEDSLNANGDINKPDRGGLIIPRGVVAVFPLETKLP
jgi:hypothetical protein